MNAAVEQQKDVTRDGFADVEESSKFLAMSRASVYKLMEAGKLPFAKFGKSRRIPWRALREYAAGCLVGAR